MLVKTLGAETQRTPRSRAATTEGESASALPPDVRRWLCLAVSVWFSFWAVPLVRALPGSKSFAKKPLKAEPEPRAQPKLRRALTARHSHRLTSGGEAVTKKLLKKTRI